jgi:hypothetical protein
MTGDCFKGMGRIVQGTQRDAGLGTIKAPACFAQPSPVLIVDQ